MNKQTKRARLVALFILLMFTVGIYFFWSYTDDITTANSTHHVELRNGHER
ncbi:MAG: hypothetical protein ACE5EO_08330 [Candidatus Krumholzibacteriia bacterium]